MAIAASSLPAPAPLVPVLVKASMPALGLLAGHVPAVVKPAPVLMSPSKARRYGLVGSGATTIVVVHDPEPPGPFTVMRYVVVAPGETDLLPLDTGATFPMPWSMEAEVAFEAVQERFEEPPVAILLGVAVRVQEARAGTGIEPRSRKLYHKPARSLSCGLVSQYDLSAAWIAMTFWPATK